jgi:NHL repeat
MGTAADSGDLYVADSGNNRIEKFTHDGTYLLTIKPTFPPKTFLLKIYVDQQCLY